MGPEKIVAVVLLISMMLHTGLQVNRERVRAILTNYGMLGRAFLANFVLVPIYGVLLVRAFHLSAPIATGVLLMAISPGVPFVVMSGGRQKGGSLGLAVSLAFLMPALSVITVPITAHWILPEISASTTGVVVSLVAFQVLPLSAGMLINDRNVKAATRLRRPLTVILIVAMIVLFALLAPRIWASIASVYGSRGMLAMLSLVLLSSSTGWLLGGAAAKYRRTLAIGTVLRNIGLAAMIATTTFAGKDAAAAVVTYFVIQCLFVILIGIAFTRTAKSSVGVT